MDLLIQLAQMVLHLDKTLPNLIDTYGLWIYGILFLIIFCETGLVVLPFLPGDSLLFVAGMLAVDGKLNLALLLGLLSVAAILGNSVNYAIGNFLGPRVFLWPNSRFFNRDALDRAHRFYEEHGGKTLIMTRFMPILRTFTPFVAGVSSMTFTRFQLFNISGALLWIVSLTCAGFFLGNIPFIKNNLTAVILVIIAVSLLPAFIAWFKNRGAKPNPSEV